LKRESLPRMIKSSNQTKTEGFPMDQFTKDLTKTLLSNGDVKELFRQQLETAINRILQAELTALLGYDPYDRCGFNSGNSRNGQYYRLIDSE